MNLDLAVGRFDRLLQDHFKPKDGTTPRSVRVHFDSQEKATKFRLNVDWTMRALGDLLPEGKVVPFPLMFAQLRTAIREFIEVIPKGTLSESAADFLNVKWLQDTDYQERGRSENGHSKTHEVGLVLTPYEGSWLAAFRAQVEATNGLPVVSLEDSTIAIKGKKYIVEDVELLKVIQLLASEHRVARFPLEDPK